MVLSKPSRPSAALATLVLLAAGAFALGCGETVPVQPIRFNDGILSMAISQDWALQRDGGKQAYYRHTGMEGVKLSFEDQTEDLGQPMNVVGVRSMIGSELNRMYGGVDARLGFGGCAVLTYKRKVKEGSKKVYTHNWVVAHPYGYGAIARVAITLTAPDGKQGTAELQELIALLDKQVGDAKMPEA